MSRKHRADAKGIVYSTDPDYRREESAEEPETLPPGRQPLRIRLETRHRAGKQATVVQGFIGRQADLESLGKELRNLCGAGGSAKDGEIIVQGDHRDKVKAWLLQRGYAAK